MNGVSADEWDTVLNEKPLDGLDADVLVNCFSLPRGRVSVYRQTISVLYHLYLYRRGGAFSTLARIAADVTLAGS